MKTKGTRKVWLNPVERTSAQGRHRQYYQTYDINGLVVNTRNMKKVKEYDTASVYMFPTNKETNMLHTTMQNMIANPLKGLDKDQVISKYNVHPEWHEKLDKILDKDKVTKQVYYEIKHGKQPNAYASNARWSIFNLPPGDIKKRLDEGRGELDSMEMVLYPKANYFEDTTPTQELKICMIDALVEMGLIAKSKDTAIPYKHEFYISEDNEEETRASQKRDIVEAGMFRLYKLKNEATFFKQYQFAVVLRTKQNQTLIKGQSTPERVKNQLSEYISDRNKNQMDHVDRFINLFDLQSTPEGADRFHIMYLVQQGLNTGVLMHRDGEYIWPSKSNDKDAYQLGQSFEKIVSFLLKEMNTPTPKGKKIVTNYYHDLLAEVKAKNVPFE